LVDLAGVDFDLQLRAMVGDNFFFYIVVHIDIREEVTDVLKH
jgi:hypothetical protein